LYAKEGLFEGTIRTSKIIGSGDKYGLDIVGNPNATTNALRFSDGTTEFL
jgi:hypothetical protein